MARVTISELCENLKASEDRVEMLLEIVAKQQSIIEALSDRLETVSKRLDNECAAYQELKKLHAKFMRKSKPETTEEYNERITVEEAQNVISKYLLDKYTLTKIDTVNGTMFKVRITKRVDKEIFSLINGAMEAFGGKYQTSRQSACGAGWYFEKAPTFKIY